MQVLSKPINPCTLSYRDYFKNNVVLSKYRLKQLKEIARENNLKISGTKPVLIDRITNIFSNTKNIVKIQSIMRMFLVKELIKCKGEALRNRKLCVNDTDFYTLEPLENLNFFEFFSYKDSNNFFYGFDIFSILTLLQKPGHSKNPYNRINIPFHATKSIAFISKIQKHICNKRDKPPVAKTLREQTMHRMKELRKNNIEKRIENLFYEIDSLGNYSSKEWIMNIGISSYIKLIRHLWDIWTMRANIPNEIKRKICPYFDPFIDGHNHINFRNRENAQNIDLVRDSCVTTMENMIYTGINDEYKQQGAIVVLTAITLISQNAREILPWLYESAR
jgi:hypothetical protein